jgi:hypothetical protein
MISHMAREVSEEWGFGLAPPKKATELHRLKSAEQVLRLLEHPDALRTAQTSLEAISEVKGLFNRVARQDQWDWFTVAQQLGHPSSRISRVIAMYLGYLRTALRNDDKDLLTEYRSNLCRLPTRKCLKVFLGAAEIANEENAGWIYILSTRETPDLLQVGMTERTIEQEVRELNDGTGVGIPFGVRCCWRVHNPKRAEAIVRAALEPFRIRGDSALFRLQFSEAKERIGDELTAHSLEIRTLDNLSALADT